MEVKKALFSQMSRLDTLDFSENCLFLASERGIRFLHHVELG